MSGTSVVPKWESRTWRYVRLWKKAATSPVSWPIASLARRYTTTTVAVPNSATRTRAIRWKRGASSMIASRNASTDG